MVGVTGDDMIKEIYELYERCFPGIIRSRQHVEKMLARPENHIIKKEVDGKFAGVSVIHKNTIHLFCVAPEFRGRGIGSALLLESEEYIAGNGYEEVCFCDGDDYITPGIPLYEGNREFFEKRGYVHSWGEDECVDMQQDLSGFNYAEQEVGDTINGVTYRWAYASDLPAVLDSVESAYPEFVDYYKAPWMYEAESASRVLAAFCDGKVCGTLMVENQTEAPGVGSVGCTATRKEYQGRGIATTMVKLGTRYLKELGLPKAYLGYTYTDIIPMYGKSGYEVSMKYFMGKKRV